MSNTTGIQPVMDRVLIEVSSSTGKMQGGLYLPDAPAAMTVEGTVLAIGDECKHVKPGCEIIAGKGLGAVINHQSRKLMLYAEKDIFAIINQ